MSYFKWIDTVTINYYNILCLCSENILDELPNLKDLSCSAQKKWKMFLFLHFNFRLNKQLLFSRFLQKSTVHKQIAFKLIQINYIINHHAIKHKKTKSCKYQGLDPHNLGAG